MIEFINDFLNWGKITLSSKKFFFLHFYIIINIDRNTFRQATSINTNGFALSISLLETLHVQKSLTEQSSEDAVYKLDTSKLTIINISWLYFNIIKHNSGNHISLTNPNEQNTDMSIRGRKGSLSLRREIRVLLTTILQAIKIALYILYITNLNIIWCKHE